MPQVEYLKQNNKIKASRANRIFILCALLVFIAFPSFAIEEQVTRKNIFKSAALENDLRSKMVTYSGVIDYDSVLQAAVDNSYDIKTSQVNIEISKQRLSGAKREYIPDLNVRVNTEYNKGLDDNSQGIRTVNGVIINGATRFQDSVSVNLQYTLLDYGIKKQHVNIASFDIIQKETVLVQTLRDLKLQILDLYTRILITYFELENLKTEYTLQKELLSMQERLYRAGLCSKIEVKQTEADLNSVQIKIENTNLGFAELLAELSFYTNTGYSTSLENVKPFTQKNPMDLNLDEIDYTKSSEYISYQKEIDKKHSELSILKRQRLPQVAMYSGYSIYGTDKGSFSSSASDMRQSNIAVGLSTNLGVTEQFKQTPKIKELELQINSLQIEQARNVSNFFKEVNRTKQLIGVYEVEKLKNDEFKMVLDTKLKMLERLDNKRLINKTDLIFQQIQNNRQNTEFKIIEQKAVAQSEKLKYLLEDVNALGAIGINNI